MTTLRPLVFILLGMAALAAPAFAQESLSGNVVNEATGRALEGARVALQGTERETLTDRQGAFRFDNLAPGPVTLVVSYSGLDSANVPVTVAAGQPTRREVRLSSQIYAMTKFVVAGEREGNAQAVTLQRLSDGVKNVSPPMPSATWPRIRLTSWFGCRASRATRSTARSATCASAGSIRISRRSRWMGIGSPTRPPPAPRASTSFRR